MRVISCESQVHGWDIHAARNRVAGARRQSRQCTGTHEHVSEAPWAPGSAAQGGLPLHARQLLGVAYGVQPGDEAVVEADREDGIDLAVEPDDQRGEPVDLCRL